MEKNVPGNSFQDLSIRVNLDHYLRNRDFNRNLYLQEERGLVLDHFEPEIIERRYRMDDMD